MSYRSEISVFVTFSYLQYYSCFLIFTFKIKKSFCKLLKYNFRNYYLPLKVKVAGNIIFKITRHFFKKKCAGGLQYLDYH